MISSKVSYFLSSRRLVSYRQFLPAKNLGTLTSDFKVKLSDSLTVSRNLNSLVLIKKECNYQHCSRGKGGSTNFLL